MQPPRAYRNRTKQPAKLAAIIPAGATVSTDSDELAAQLAAAGLSADITLTGPAEAAEQLAPAPARQRKPKPKA